MMNGNLRVEGEQAVLTVGGDFQGRNAADVRDALIECLQNGHHSIVVDLTDVSAINATGLGVLISIQQRLESLDGKLSLQGVNNSLKQVFERTRLCQTFGI
jgi:anti-sigma B factor antagonist